MASCAENLRKKGTLASWHWSRSGLAQLSMFARPSMSDADTAVPITADHADPRYRRRLTTAGGNPLRRK